MRNRAAATGRLGIHSFAYVSCKWSSFGVWEEKGLCVQLNNHK